MLEYILLTASVDEMFNKLVFEVAQGRVKEFAPSKVMPGSGLEPPVSVPQKPDDKPYIDGLRADEREIFEMYREILENGDEAGLVALVRNGQLKTDARDKEGQTPLHIAVEAGFSAQTIVTLASLGCDLDAKSSDGTTPLHAALFTENSELFEQLAKLGADPDVEDDEGVTVRQECKSKYAQFD
jgi:hypothetical protein